MTLYCDEMSADDLRAYMTRLDDQSDALREEIARLERRLRFIDEDATDVEAQLHFLEDADVAGPACRWEE